MSDTKITFICTPRFSAIHGFGRLCSIVLHGLGMRGILKKHNIIVHNIPRSVPISMECNINSENKNQIAQKSHQKPGKYLELQLTGKMRQGFPCMARGLSEQSDVGWSPQLEFICKRLLPYSGKIYADYNYI